MTVAVGDRLGFNSRPHVQANTFVDLVSAAASCPLHSVRTKDAGLGDVDGCPLVVIAIIYAEYRCISSESIPTALLILSALEMRPTVQQILFADHEPHPVVGALSIGFRRRGVDR
jgi:hypothetical protein